MQRDFLPGVPEAVGMCSERLGRISTMLAGMVADKKLRAFPDTTCAHGQQRLRMPTVR
jgi:hypothetical protein